MLAAVDVEWNEGNWTRGRIAWLAVELVLSIAERAISFQSIDVVMDGLIWPGNLRFVCYDLNGGGSEKVARLWMVT